MWDRASERLFLGQTWGAWLIALSLIPFAAWLTISTLNTVEARAYWLRVAVEGSCERPPEVLVRDYSGGKALGSLAWQPYANTSVGLDRLEGSGSFSVLSIETDVGPQPLPGVAVLGSDLVKANDGSVTVAGAAMLRWPTAAKQVTITLGPGEGLIRLAWHDLTAVARLSPVPQTLTLKLAGKFQGWLLLPPRELRGLSLTSAASECSYSNAVIFSEREFRWSASSVNPPISTVAGRELSLDFEGAALNPPFVSRQIVASFGIALLIVVALALLRWMAVFVNPRLDLLPRSRKSADFTAIAVAGLAVVVVFAFHIVYALVLPLVWNSDSVGYYAAALALLQTGSLAAVGIRTPGYPLLLAGLINFFGDSPGAVVMAQHLCLAALGPLAIIALRRRFGLPGASIVGFFAGLSPVASIMGNSIMTEALFAAAIGATGIVYVGYGNSLKGLFWTGFLAGAALLVRPTGLLLIAALVGWVLAMGWCARSWPEQRRAIAGAVALCAGYAVLAGPWHLYTAIEKKTIDPTFGSSLVFEWTAASSVGLVGPDLEANRPDRSIWRHPNVWNNNPFEIMYYYWSPISVQPPVTGRYTEEALRYMRESIRESRQNTPDEWNDVVRLAFIYNSLFMWTGPAAERPVLGGLASANRIYFPNLHGTLNELSLTGDAQQATHMPTVAGSAEERLRVGSLRAINSGSFPRMLSLWVSRVMLENWSLFAIGSAVLSVVSLYVWPQLFAVYLFWFGVIATTSMIGVAIDRYVAVVEPLLYLTSGVLLIILCSVFRSTWRAPPACRRPGPIRNSLTSRP
jgi:hypothetical protein